MFQFLNTLTTAELLNFFADLFNFFLLIATVIIVVLTYRQIKEGYRTQKATFFKELYSVMFSDPDILEAYRLIEYEEFSYDDDHFHDSVATGKAIDRMLHFFNLICDLYKQGILSEREMNIFRYKLLRAYQSPDVQRYISFLEIFYLTTGVQAEHFQSFRSYGAREQRRLHYPEYLTVDQAYWFYKEQKSKLDSLLVVAERQLPAEKDIESDLQRKLQAIDILKARLQAPHDFDHEDALCKAIRESTIYDPPRIIIGLDALKTRLLTRENNRLQSEGDDVPEKVSIKHLFRN